MSSGDRRTFRVADFGPNDILTSDDIGHRRVKVETLTIQESAIVDGRFFTGASDRQGVTVLDTPYNYVVIAGANGLVIDDIIITLDFSNTAAGIFGYTLEVFVDASSGNTWSYTPVAEIPIGRSMNAEFINNLPLSTIQSDVSASVSGSADYVIYFADYYIDTQGNRNNESVTESKFFSAGRQIVLPPGTEILVRASISGNATGSADIRSLFFVSESA